MPSTVNGSAGPMQGDHWHQHRHRLVFAKLYFPQSDPLMGILQAFAVYAGRLPWPVGPSSAHRAHLATLMLPDYTNRDVSTEYDEVISSKSRAA